MISYDPYPVIPWEWKWTWLRCSVLRIVAVHPCCNAATCCTMTCWWKATLDLMLWRLLAEIDGFRWIPMDFDGFWWCHCFPMLTRRVAVEAQVFHGLCHLLQEGSMLELCLENHFGGLRLTLFSVSLSQDRSWTTAFVGWSKPTAAHHEWWGVGKVSIDWKALACPGYYTSWKHMETCSRDF